MYAEKIKKPRYRKICSGCSNEYRTVPPELSLNYINTYKAVLFGRVVPYAPSGKLFSGCFSLCGTGCKDISHGTYYITGKTVCQEIRMRKISPDPIYGNFDDGIFRKLTGLFLMTDNKSALSAEKDKNI